MTVQDGRRSRSDIPAEVIAASRKNFLHYGVSRTTMADIARAVGIPRQTLYSYVSSREDLVDAVLVRRIQEIADEIKPATTRRSFEDAFVETSLAAVDKARNDPELMNIFTTGPADRVRDVVTGDFPEIHAIVANLLGPIFDRGEEAGVLRTDKTRDEIVDWIRVVYLALINQPPGDATHEEAYVADFLLPSIMFSRKRTTKRG
ncbi:regulatory protein TetR [Mycolicibacterium rhodesiae JS60]|nr:regulatory protein TetR [Mycolicibacterium rhodesiae JS60]